MSGLAGVVLVTGGTGSLGQAILARAAAEGWDARFIVYSRDEVKQAAVRAAHPDVRCVLGDVRDAETLEAAMRGVDVVVHAAAYKRVPEAERETMACVQANVVGSMTVVREALRVGVPRVIGISTDKACSPISAYGASKMLMERLFQSVADRLPRVSFALVRFGNVIASRGSVVPLFRAQAEAGGPLRLTDPTMTRFWLTLDDAVDLVVASVVLDSGTVLVPRCWASSMATMAEAVAPGVPTVTIGARSAEKHDEQVLNAHESPYAREAWPCFLLRPLSGAPDAQLPDGFEYRSDTAPQFTPAALRDVLLRMDAGEVVRTVGTYGA